MLFGLIAISPSLIEHVVSAKWQPALPLIYLFSIGAFWATLSSPFTNFLNAIGKIKTTLKLMVMWTALEWVLTPFLTLYFGYFGVGIASAMISVTSIIPIFIIKKIIDVKIIKNIWQAITASIIMANFTFFFSRIFVKDFFTLFLVILISALIYSAILYLLCKERLVKSFTFKNA